MAAGIEHIRMLSATSECRGRLVHVVSGLGTGIPYEIFSHVTELLAFTTMWFLVPPFAMLSLLKDLQLIDGDSPAGKDSL